MVGSRKNKCRGLLSLAHSTICQIMVCNFTLAFLSANLLLVNLRLKKNPEQVGFLLLGRQIFLKYVPPLVDIQVYSHQHFNYRTEIIILVLTVWFRIATLSPRKRGVLIGKRDVSSSLDDLTFSSQQFSRISVSIYYRARYLTVKDRSALCSRKTDGSLHALRVALVFSLLQYMPTHMFAIRCTFVKWSIFWLMNIQAK